MKKLWPVLQHMIFQLKKYTRHRSSSRTYAAHIHNNTNESNGTVESYGKNPKVFKDKLLSIKTPQLVMDPTTRLLELGMEE